jgi:hypothetical protein
MVTMSRLCPKCGYGDSSRERFIDGRTTCNACGYTVSNIQWDNEQSEAELNCGVSSRLRGNPLEIEKRYFAMEERIKELEEQLEHNEDICYELEQNLLCAEDQNHYFQLMGEYRDKHYESERKIEDLKRELEYFTVNVIESYGMKYHVHVNTYEKAIDYLKNRNKK